MTLLQLATRVEEIAIWQTEKVVARADCGLDEPERIKLANQYFAAAAALRALASQEKIDG